MPTETEQYVERARQQSEAFAQQARQQMMQNMQSHRAMNIGQGPGQPGVSEMPQMGTPAGRMLDTISSLVRQGTAFGGGVAGATGQGLAAIGGGIGAAAGFINSPNVPYGVGGVRGGGPMGATQGFLGTAFTGYGAGLPLGLGRYAGQRMEMTALQAGEQAREELGYRVSGGLRRGAFGVLNAATLGIAGSALRRQGMGFETINQEEFARGAQQRLRFMTDEQAARVGFEGGGGRGTFATGINRAAATQIGMAEARAMGTFEKRMGLSAAETQTLAGQAATLMGGRGYAKMYSEMGVEGGAAEITRQMGSLKDVRQLLHLTEADMKTFIDTRKQILGSADNLKKMAQESVRIGGALGLDVQQVNQMMTGFAIKGIRAGTGRAQTMAAQGAAMQQMAEAVDAGVISREQLFRYGGNTTAEALQIQMQVRSQQNLAAYQRGALGGIGAMATQDREAYSRFRAGQGFMRTAGDVGSLAIRDPFFQLRASYDKEQQRMMETQGDRDAYLKATSRIRDGMYGMFKKSDQRLMALDEFRGTLGIDKMDASDRFAAFEQEVNVFRHYAKSGGLGGDEDQHATNMSSLYNKVLAEGTGEALRTSMGAPSILGAVSKFYSRLTKGGKEKIDVTKSTTDLLAKAINAPPSEIVGNLDFEELKRGFFVAQRDIGTVNRDIAIAERGGKEKSSTLYGLRKRRMGLLEELYEARIPELNRALNKQNLGGDRGLTNFLLGGGAELQSDKRDTPDKIRFVGTDLAREDADTGEMIKMSYADMASRYGAGATASLFAGISERMSALSLTGKGEDPIKRRIRALANNGQISSDLQDFASESAVIRNTRMFSGLDLTGVPEDPKRKVGWYLSMLMAGDTAERQKWSPFSGNLKQMGALLDKSPKLRQLAEGIDVGLVGNADTMTWGSSLSGISSKKMHSYLYDTLGSKDDKEFKIAMAKIFKASGISTTKAGLENAGEWGAEDIDSLIKSNKLTQATGNKDFLRELVKSMISKKQDVLKLERGDSAGNPMIVKVVAGQLTDPVKGSK